MTDQEKIIEKIRRCLALSKSSNEHEAAIAATKAQELLFKYNLKLSQIESAPDFSEKKTKATHRFKTLESEKNYGRWRITLGHRIARYNFCTTLLFGRDTMIFIGQPHNIDIVTELYEWTSEQILRFAAESCKTYRGYDKVRKYRRSFLEGAVSTVCNRLYQKWMDLQKESVTSTALVVNHGVMLANYISNTWSELGKGRANRGSGSYDGHLDGRVAGHKVDLISKRKLISGENKRLS